MSINFFFNSEIDKISRSFSNELITSKNKCNGTLFLSQSLKSIVNIPFFNNLLTFPVNLSSCLTKCLECSYENILDTCSVLINSSDNFIIIRTSLGIISEVLLLIKVYYIFYLFIL